MYQDNSSSPSLKDTNAIPRFLIHRNVHYLPQTGDHSKQVLSYEGILFVGSEKGNSISGSSSFQQP